jgi:hypothetical protein
MIITLLGSTGGSEPSAPTIGTATAGDASATVAFTASSYIGKGTIIYIATSTPGSFVASSATSPITFSGLSNGTSYTFTVTGATNYSVESAASAASNAVVPAVPPVIAPVAPVIAPVAPVDPCAGCPAYDTYLGQNCNGTYLQQVYADGCCGQYVKSSAQVHGYCGYAANCSSCVLSGSATTHDGCPGGVTCRQIVYTYTCAPAGCAGCNCPDVYDGICTGGGCPY